MPIVPFLVMATYFLPEPLSSARKYPKMGFGCASPAINLSAAL
jgi:hypothetical protein